MWESILKNWTTSVPGALAFVCGLTELFNLLPPQFSKYLIAFCGFLIAIGLIAAKSANVHSTTAEVASAKP